MVEISKKDDFVMKKTFSLSVILVSAAAMLAAGSALAQTKDRSFKDWTVYTTSLQGKKTCYIGSFPVSKSGNYSKRDEPYFLVTRINSNTSEVSTSSGYPYKSGSSVRVTIGSKKFSLYTKGELSWAKTKADDKTVINNMKAGSSMTVRGTSQKGTYSVDKYSLSGFTAAYKHMEELCGK